MSDKSFELSRLNAQLSKVLAEKEDLRTKLLTKVSDLRELEQTTAHQTERMASQLVHAESVIKQLREHERESTEDAEVLANLRVSLPKCAYLAQQGFDFSADLRSAKVGGTANYLFSFYPTGLGAVEIMFVE